MLTMTDPMNGGVQSRNDGQNTNDHNVKRFSLIRRNLASWPKDAREVRKDIEHSRLYCLTSVSRKEVIIIIAYTLDKNLTAQFGQGNDEVQILSIRCKWLECCLPL